MQANNTTLIQIYSQCSFLNLFNHYFMKIEYIRYPLVTKLEKYYFTFLNQVRLILDFKDSLEIYF